MLCLLSNIAVMHKKGLSAECVFAKALLANRFSIKKDRILTTDRKMNTISTSLQKFNSLRVMSRKETNVLVEIHMHLHNSILKCKENCIKHTIYSEGAMNS